LPKTGFKFLKKWGTFKVDKTVLNNKKENYQTEQEICSELQNRKPAANVLLIDNDRESVRVLLEVLARKGICGTVVNNKKDAVEFLDKNGCDLIFTFIQADQPQNSFELIRQIKTNSPQMPIIMTAEIPEQKARNLQHILDITVETVKAGCCCLLLKPLDCKKVENILDTLLPNHNVSMADFAEQDAHTLYRIVGKNPKLIQTVNLAKKIAPTSAPVLISGESGTGKELVSFLIHHNSQRAQGPYVRVNCAALSDSLLESELFGHEKGAFTGAYARRKGRFEMAHGGTLLLDEITETPPNFQAKLLRVLEQQDFERVGGNDSIKVDVRIISTTNKDLLQEVTEGRFRKDLYYRLSGVRLIIPPLRQRIDDLPELVWHFVNLNARQVQRKITKLDPAMIKIFEKYHWPGNVRQLRNVVLTSLFLGSGTTLSLADASWLFNELQPLTQKNNLSIGTDKTSGSVLAGLPLQQVERRAILDTLNSTAGNQTKAAKILGISDRTLREKIRQYRKQECLQPA
jgi:DNA-binding NtrC family response regulator